LKNDDEISLPDNFSIKTYPNPFNPSLNIDYGLSKASHVNLVIYDIKGQIVKSLINSRMEAGYHSTVWDSKNAIGRQVSAGIYFCSILTNNSLITKKIVLVK
jgi:flagellar hook assembly protein FlgD